MAGTAPQVQVGRLLTPARRPPMTVSLPAHCQLSGQVGSRSGVTSMVLVSEVMVVPVLHEPLSLL